MLVNTCTLSFEFVEQLSSFEVVLQHLTFYPEDALAVNFPYILHSQERDAREFPKQLVKACEELVSGVVTLVEQELNRNTAPFPYIMSALFELINIDMLRDNKDWTNVEQHCLGRDVVNIIACEGVGMEVAVLNGRV
ncbi:scarecrow-like protein 5 [Silene latifolia]|uniref:scarecrow-like protein 5 n=1 Tax=Silene latifolia TaxID=37657 RepID=UPI003D76C6BF